MNGRNTTKQNPPYDAEKKRRNRDNVVTLQPQGTLYTGRCPVVAGEVAVRCQKRINGADEQCWVALTAEAKTWQ